MAITYHETEPAGVEFDDAHKADMGILQVVNGDLYQLLQDVSGDEYFVKVPAVTVDAGDINP